MQRLGECGDTASVDGRAGRRLEGMKNEVVGEIVRKEKRRKGRRKAWVEAQGKRRLGWRQEGSRHPDGEVGILTSGLVLDDVTMYTAVLPNYSVLLPLFFLFCSLHTYIITSGCASGHPHHQLNSNAS